MGVPNGTPRLLCVGDIDIDIILRVAAPPGKDQKVDGERVGQSPGGMAANVAVGASRLGTRTRLLGAVGDDAMGREALQALGQEDIDLAHVAIRSGEATFFCLILVDDEGEKSLVKAVTPAYLPRPADLTEEAFADVAHVHLTFTRPDLLRTAILRARQAGASVSLDLEAADIQADAGQLRDMVAAVDVLFISAQSRSEAERRIGPLPYHPDQCIVTTRGHDGATLERGAMNVAVAGNAVPVTDTSGAGDSFASGFLSAWLGGADEKDALCFANAAAALSVRAYGAQAGLPTADEVHDFLRTNKPVRRDA